MTERCTLWRNVILNNKGFKKEVTHRFEHHVFKQSYPASIMLSNAENLMPHAWKYNRNCNTRPHYLGKNCLFRSNKSSNIPATKHFEFRLEFRALDNLKKFESDLHGLSKKEVIGKCLTTAFRMHSCSHHTRMSP